MRKFSIVEPIEKTLCRGFGADHLKSMLPAIFYPELRLATLSLSDTVILIPSRFVVQGSA